MRSNDLTRTPLPCFEWRRGRGVRRPLAAFVGFPFAVMCPDGTVEHGEPGDALVVFPDDCSAQPARCVRYRRPWARALLAPPAAA